MAEQKVEVAQEEADSLIENRTLIVELMKQNASLQAQLQDQELAFTEERATLQAEIHTLTQDRKAAVDFAEQFKIEAEKSAQSLAIAQSKIAELTAERDTYKSQTETATGLLVRLKAKKDALESDLNQSRDLNTSLNDAEAQIARLTVERDTYKSQLETAARLLQSLNAKKKGLESDLNQSRGELAQVHQLNASLVSELERSRINDSHESGNEADVSLSVPAVLQPGHELPAEVRRQSALVQGEPEQEEDDEVVRHPSPRDVVSRQAIVKSDDSFFSGVARFASQHRALTATAAAGIGVAAVVIKSIL